VEASGVTRLETSGRAIPPGESVVCDRQAWMVWLSVLQPGGRWWTLYASPVRR
jgi:hypothetical protein